jgi:hypothetical protein
MPLPDSCGMRPTRVIGGDGCEGERFTSARYDRQSRRLRWVPVACGGLRVPIASALGDVGRTWIQAAICVSLVGWVGAPVPGLQVLTPQIKRADRPNYLPLLPWIQSFPQSPFFNGQNLQTGPTAVPAKSPPRFSAPRMRRRGV